MLLPKLTVGDHASPLYGTPETLSRWDDCPRVPFHMAGRGAAPPPGGW